ncbi:hypothetical protein [Acidisoma sp. 7E03]
MRKSFLGQTALAGALAIASPTAWQAARAQSVSCSIGGNSAACGSNGFTQTAIAGGSQSAGITNQGPGTAGYGILAQSIGGAGDMGGTATTVNLGPITLPALASISAAIANGSGGNGNNGAEASGFASSSRGQTGGNGAAASITNQSLVQTAVSGVAALSALADAGSGGAGGAAGDFESASGGGGGGIGGTASVTTTASGSVTTTGDHASAIAAFAQGGVGGTGGGGDAPNNAQAGGSGGNGGTAEVTNAAALSTSGTYALGVDAEALGGAGGNGGASTSATNSGDGAAGGAGGTVSIGNTGIIQTDGASALGVKAAADGGAGGTGPETGEFRDAGGSGGNGGQGGSVTVTLGAGSQITTQAASATALLATADGGAGGLSVNNGTGGQGGAAGSVSVTAAGPIVTAGTGSAGIDAEAAGGTGGTGGVGGYNGSAGIGGAGGKGAAATVSTSAVLQTNGGQSDGVVAVADGGAGGTGGAGAVGNDGQAGGAAGAGGTATITNSGTVQTMGQQSLGLYASAQGGAGGAGGASGSVSDGGSGGQGGAGGIITIRNANGTVQTSGQDATAILANAMGGAGGAAQSGGDVNSTGGDGAAGGQGGTISIQNTGLGFIATTGQGAGGIVALASGGAGSTAGSGEDGQGSAGAGGAAGPVTISNAGLITTTGETAAGIQVTAKGGLGGDGGSSPDGASAGAAGGQGGAVTLTDAGTITTAGSSAPVITIDSSGGTGGIGQAEGASHGGAAGGAGGTAGRITVSLTPGATLRSIGGNAPALSLRANGGAGGEGGLSYSASGAGGAGGTGGAVALALAGLLGTAGTESDAVTVEANGGAGGSSGRSPTAGATAGTIAIAPAGAGQSLGITTAGVEAAGISAEAIGGAGGAGLSGDVSAANGAQGGSGGAVTLQLSNAATITTIGSLSPAVALLSQGGAGGDGADYINLIGSTGNGAAGGAGAAVSVTAAGRILTQGNYASGIFAESMGGNGGAGGLTTAAVDSQGGSGGIGGDDGVIGGAPIVSVSTSGSIQTLGFGATAIDAESWGGNGGAGGGANGLVTAIGGNSGAGGSGGDVAVSNSGSVGTNGDAAFGILGLSVGGGSGSGGNADSLAPIVDVSVGGDASGGGSGGNVTIGNSGTITTNGATGFGILAESVGGGGGNGGTVNASSASFILPTISVAIGGAGGNGGPAGNTTVTNSGSITTTGFGSTGIEALSIGGGGGTGGGASTSSYEVGFGELPAITVTTAIGGTGGTGGNAGTISIANTGSITTDADLAAAIAAYSVGGGGGDGGNATTLSYSFGTAPQITLDVAVGGTGGAGGAGNTVTVTNAGGLTTNGYAASALYAASIGGGGGNGGTGAAVTSTELPGADWVPVSLGTSYALTLGLGGDGGAGSTGGAVTIANSGAIATHGIDSQGIFAQSIGGGGGIGASGQAYSTDKEQLNISVGGAGGSGATGGAVTVTNAASGTITTTADGATAIEAQSVGGGGGTAGTSSAGTTNSVLEQAQDMGIENALYATVKALLPKFAAANKIGPEFTPSVSVSLAVGGNGGTGGNGGAVTVTNQGQITTNGNLADGILAQSVGGGGGIGGAAAESGANLITEGFGLGGTGGAGGDGEGVTVTNSGAITTTGGAAFGILGQSVGGGGGLASLGTTETLLDFTISADLGGYGNQASAGGGGTVSIQNTGSITTSGAESHGLIAQSIGGGGGIERLNPNGTIASTGSDTALSNLIQSELTSLGFDIAAYTAGFEQALQQAAGTLSIDLGGQGSTGNGGTVAVTENGSISTTGANAFGLVAQSIGGGGGLVASSGTFAQPVTLKSGTLGGGNGDGGPVSVTFGGNNAISTSGVGATALLAQSIGGGGGYTGAVTASGVSYQAFLAATPLTNGIGGAVSIALNGQQIAPLDITTTGANAHGIFAQSLSGGGGAVGSANGISIPVVQNNTARTGTITDTTAPGDVTINLNAHISTTGAGSVGIYAQDGVQGSTGAIVSPASQNGSITVTYEGKLMGGAGTGAGIQLDGGNQNTILLLIGSQVAAQSNTAIVASLGQTTLDNYGTITGSVDLNTTGQATGAVFHNEAGGTYASVAGASPLILAGSGGTASGLLQNDGTVIVGGRGAFGRIDLAGNYVQSPSGILAADVSALGPQRADLLSASGTAALAGTVQMNVTDSLLPGSYQVLQAAGGIINGGVSASQRPGTFVPVTWTTQQGTQSLSVSPTVHFNTSGLATDRNGQSLQTYWQSTWDAGGSAALAPLYARLVNLPTAAAYGTAVNSSSAEHFGTAPAVRLGDAQGSLSAVLSCPMFEGHGVDLVETDCVWARLSGGSAAEYSSPQGLGYHATSAGYRIGGEHAIAPDWFLAASAAYDTSWSVGNNGSANSLGQGFDLSASLKHQMGHWLVGLAADFGNMWYQNSRTVQIGSNTATAASDSQALSASGRLRVSYEFPFDHWYIKPYSDLDLIYVSVPGFSESGSSGTNMAIAGSSQTTLGISPNVEIGGRVDRGPDWTLRPYATIGATFLSNANWTTEASLEGAPSGSARYSTSTPLPSAFANVGLGLQLLRGQRYELRAELMTHVSPNYLSESGNLRFAYHF